jgi:hypothetical protein
MMAVVVAGALSLTGLTREWGVNGHPGAQEGYRQIPVEEQLARVRDLGMTWYRCDWSQHLLQQDPEFHDRLVNVGDRFGVRILPVVFPETGPAPGRDPAVIREAAEDFGRWLATRFGDRITHWELANERDIYAMIRKGETTRSGRLWEWGAPDGDQPDHYEETRYQQVRAEIEGLYTGIKAVCPEAMTIVDTAGWLHYGIIDRLVNEDRVVFDILGWHWYSEMGDPTSVRGEFDLIAHLKRYGKPLWFTELNRRGGSQGGQGREQAEYLVEMAQTLDRAGVEAFFAYELFDEPYFGPENPESHYGLVEVVRGLDQRWRPGPPKPAFHVLRALLRPETAPLARRPLVPLPGPGRDNPFGTHTTCLNEGMEAGRIEAFLEDVAGVGYGWVKDYVAAGPMAAPDEIAARWTEFPPHYETYLRTASRLELKVLLRVDAPHWTGDADGPEPVAALCEAYAGFCTRLVEEFGDWVQDWEIDNEPNIGNQNPRMAPEHYLALGRAAAEAIRRADPEARVYGPAASMLQCLDDHPYPYIDRLVQGGLLEWIDRFSYHPYRQPYLRVNVPEHASEFHPWQTWGTYFQQIEALRHLLRSAGRTVPLAVTEVGWPTHTDSETGVQEITWTTQAKYEQRAMILDFMLGIEPRIQFVFKRPWADPGELEHQFNMVNPDNSRRPVYAATTQVCALLRNRFRGQGAPVACRAPDETSPQAFVFTDPDRPALRLVTLWAGTPAETDYGHGLC